ncbi:terminase small subunit [Deinococcus misasensis]|uniref:terminase small subunit n=1 Tax=Deinococcus misasensis TaxID=392413 RepID=UPI000B1D3A61|nr:terminase small subunit [Deinococcus misasensis]
MAPQKPPTNTKRGKTKTPPTQKKPPKTPRTLTNMQERFCDEYMVDLNATKAAIRAGYSPKSAHVIAHDLLKNPLVAQHITTLKRKKAQKNEITAQRVIEELAAIAFSSTRDLGVWDADGLTPYPSSILTRDEAASVKRVKMKKTISQVSELVTDTTIEIEIQQHDKLAALDKLAKHFGIYKEAGDDGKNSGLLQLAQLMAQKRAEHEAKKQPGDES